MNIRMQLVLEPVAGLLKALGDEARLRLVALLAGGELCVCHLQSATGLSQPNVSRHLAVLRAAGVVESRRAGSWVHYRLARQVDPARQRVLESLLGALPAQVTRADVARLRRSQGPDACR